MYMDISELGYELNTSDGQDITNFMQYGVDLEAGYLYIGSSDDLEVDFDNKLAEKVIKGVLMLDRYSDHEWITLYLNNMGGFDEAGMAVYDILRSCRARIRVIILGQATSIAAWVVQAAEDRVKIGRAHV